MKKLHSSFAGHAQCSCIQTQRRCWLFWILALFVLGLQPAQLNLEVTRFFFFSLFSIWQFTWDKFGLKKPTLTFQVGVFACALQSGAVWQVFLTLPGRFIVVLDNVWLAASWRSCPHCIYFLSDALPNIIPCGPTAQTAETPASLYLWPPASALGAVKAPFLSNHHLLLLPFCSVLCFNTDFPPQCCTYCVHTRCSLLTHVWERLEGEKMSAFWWLSPNRLMTWR